MKKKDFQELGWEKSLKFKMDYFKYPMRLSYSKANNILCIYDEGWGSIIFYGIVSKKKELKQIMKLIKNSDNA